MNSLSFNILLEQLFSCDRYHSSQGMIDSIDLLVDYYGGTKEIFTDSLGTSWIIPPFYTVNNATIKNSRGDVIASYSDSPLFLNAYSHSVNITAPLSDLRDYIVTDPLRPDAFIFSFRRQYRHWEKGWGISLPYNLLLDLPDSEILTIDIDTSFSNAPLYQFFLGNYLDKNNVILVSHLDHPGQANDGLTSCLCINEIYHLTKPVLNNINLVCLNSVEIVGTVLHLRSHSLNSDNVAFAVNINGISIDSPFVGCQSTVHHKSIFDRFLLLLKYLDLFEISSFIGFREGWGNDEIAFHVPSINIPCSSLYRSPFPEYHTSSDDLSLFSSDAFSDASCLISSILFIIDNNLVVDNILFDHLPCLSSPFVGLYLEPSSVSGMNNSSSIPLHFSSLKAYLFPHTSLPTFLASYLDSESSFISQNPSFCNHFMNRIVSLMCYGKDLSLLDICEKLKSPPLFTLDYLLRMQSKSLITLSSKPRLV